MTTILRSPPFQPKPASSRPGTRVPRRPSPLPRRRRPRPTWTPCWPRPARPCWRSSGRKRKRCANWAASAACRQVAPGTEEARREAEAELARIRSIASGLHARWREVLARSRASGRHGLRQVRRHGRILDGPHVAQSQRREMAQWAVAQRSAMINLACRAFGISQTCYRYKAKLDAENSVIADWLVRLTNNQRNWASGCAFCTSATSKTSNGTAKGFIGFTVSSNSMITIGKAWGSRSISRCHPNASSN